MQLKRYTKQASLAEIGQSMNARFAILRSMDGGYEQITPLVKCRDFMCDVYSSTLQKYDFSIYGMSWKGSTDKVDWNGANLLLKFPSDQAKTDFFANLKKLHQIEKNNKLTLTKITEVASDEVVVEGNKVWLQNCLTFSLYTLLLRVFCYPLKEKDWITEFSKQSWSDSKYIANFDRPTLDLILDDLSLLKTTEWNGLTYAKDGVSAVHHNSGAVGVLSWHTEQSPSAVKKNTHYQELKARGLKTYIN